MYLTEKQAVNAFGVERLAPGRETGMWEVEHLATAPMWEPYAVMPRVRFCAAGSVIVVLARTESFLPPKLVGMVQNIVRLPSSRRPCRPSSPSYDLSYEPVTACYPVKQVLAYYMHQHCSHVDVVVSSLSSLMRCIGCKPRRHGGARPRLSLCSKLKAGW
jgi:hypothetical protein